LQDVSYFQTHILFFRHLRYVGTAELGDRSRQTLVRTCLDIGVSDSIFKFLNEMGFK